MSYATLLIYPAIFLLALVGAKFLKKGEYNDGYLSVPEVKAVQGIVAVCIVCHHTAQQTCVSWLSSGNIVHGLDVFSDTGYLFNAVFFFCSGFGLYKSLKSKKAYLKGFFKKRILPVWFPYLVVCFLFTFVRLFIFHENMTPLYKFTNFTGITIGYYFGWYVQAIIIFYTIFYFAFKKGASDYDSIMLVFVGVIIWNVVGLFVDHNIWFLRGEWWYNSTLLFPIGVLFGNKEAKMGEFFRKHYAKLLCIALFLFVVLINLSFFMQNTKGYYGEVFGLSLPMKMSFRLQTYFPQVLSAICFVWLLVLICMKVKFNNKALDFLGSHTLEIYLTHAFILEPVAIWYNWTKGSIFYGRPALLLLVTFVATIPLAIALKQVTKLVSKRIFC